MNPLIHFQKTGIATRNISTDDDKEDYKEKPYAIAFMYARSKNQKSIYIKVERMVT